MLSLLVEAQGAERTHRKKLQELRDQTGKMLRVASAYVTDTQLLSDLNGRKVHLLTYISKMDLITGASSINSLVTLIKAGVQCRYICEGARLHAKVYLFDDLFAVVSSANLTRKAFDENLEVGVHLSGTAGAQLVDSFECLWATGIKLDLAILATWRREIEAGRAEYTVLRNKLKNQPPLSLGESVKIVDPFESANRILLCNTNRRNSPEDERRMRDRGYAAAWERFNYPSHMRKVERGDAILMFAKGVGIIGIGVAKGKCQILEPGEPGRLAPYDVREWRVPVDWLRWKKDEDAFRIKSRNGTFFDVSEEYSSELRNNIKKHFRRVQ